MDKVTNNEEELFNSLIGKTLSGNYQLEEKIAAGGMGAVFRATDIRTNEAVAIKVLSPHLTLNPTFLKRFEREAKVGWMLSHPNIVKVFEFGATPENLLFIVMEYVTGQPLDDYLENILPITPKHCLEIVKPLASALEMAHKHSILHRDIKPANILINKSDGKVSVKLVDFGVVKLLESDIGFNESGLTVMGEVFGTPQYMAPEQLMEDPIGPAADIYALGIIVYEMLAGELPFNSLDPKDVYLFKTKKVIPELSRNYPLVPKAFDVVVRKAIDYDPTRRYQNADDFIKDFEAIVEKYPEGKIAGEVETLVEDQETFSFLEDSEEPKTPTNYQKSITVQDRKVTSGSYKNEVATIPDKATKLTVEQQLASPALSPALAQTLETNSHSLSTISSSNNKKVEANNKSSVEKVLLIVLIVLVIILVVLAVIMFRQL